MRHTILVVEDNLERLDASCEYLMELGYSVDYATEAEDAMRGVTE